MLGNIFWIIFILSFTFVSSQHEDCEIPPKVDHAITELSTNEEDDEVRAIYTCEENYKLHGHSEIFCDLDTDEWQGEPPTCEKVVHGSEEITVEGKKRKKGKGQNIQEETRISEEFAVQLDLSCMGKELLRAPSIENAIITKYNRRKKGDHLFLVAFYECNEEYELEDLDTDRLYCSNQKWIGEHPHCMSTRSEDEDYNEEENYDDEDENGYGSENNNGDGEQNYSDEYDDEEHSNNKDHNDLHESSTAESPAAHRIESTLECGSDNGGCDHECKMVQIEGEHNQRIICSCYSGFNLDPLDRRTCIDIDECTDDNGGCEQLCVNKPGTFECKCHEGLQIDTVSGKNCIDINECLLRNGHGPCQDTCMNTFGSYKCTCAGLPGTRLQHDQHTCIDAGECANANGGCSDICLTTMGRVFCLCPNGYILSDDWKTCKDIDECQYPEILKECPHGCENTPGSYVCLNRPHEQENEITPEPHTDRHDIHHTDNYHTTEIYNDPYDGDDEDDENFTDTENDIDEMSNEIDQNVRHHGHKNHHLHIVDEKCQDGYKKNENDNCVDIDECIETKTGCEHCRNVEGGYECYCPDGFDLNDDQTCSDINECEIYSNQSEEEDEDNDETHQASQSICSHTCINLIGSFLCKCPDNYHLHSDHRTCIKDYCGDLENPLYEKTKCSYRCVDEMEGFKCECPDGHHLMNDMKTCKEKDIIAKIYTEQTTKDNCNDNNNCHPGVCINLDNGFRCECPSGYTEHEYTCKDINECHGSDHGCSHECRNTHGSFECICPHGFELAHDKKTCSDINECETGSPCENVHCNNIPGGYKCECPDEQIFDNDKKICRDKDLCIQDNGNCTHFCYTKGNNVICGCPDGSELLSDRKTCVRSNLCNQDNGGCSQICDPNHDPICKCHEGYRLSTDEETCYDIDECNMENGGCAHDCENIDGGYNCLCDEGYEIDDDKHSCNDINECNENNGGCEHYCNNNDGSFSCECAFGYTVDSNQQICIDIDECSENNGNCSDICINLSGGHQCSCPEGQVLVDDERTCEYVNECQINNGGCSHDCHYEHGHVTCLCPHGYELEDHDPKSCVDINECKNNNGGCSHTCFNFHGHHKCLCPTGFELERDNRTCLDIDECIKANGNCTNICINEYGSYACACERGFELDHDGLTCKDIDECAEEMHDCSHICNNIQGTFECKCPTGFKLGHDRYTCEDIDECHELGRNAGCSDACINTLGSYHCNCPDGHVLTSDNKTCTDVDECREDIKMCSHDCVNTLGAFKCLCPQGLELSDDLVTCVDVDECGINNNNGGCSHTCENFEGSFRCRCPNGYILGDDFHNCVDLDECEEDNGGCEHLCHNTVGGFHCGCNPGFNLRADNNTCEDTDPCLYRNGGCDQICQVHRNEAVCSCNPGYQRNEITNICDDINECDIGDHRCEHFCRNTLGSHVCECQAGYTKNDKGICTDINECKYNNGGCTKQAKCINSVGSFRCSCSEGYKLSNDKKSCIEIKDLCQAIKPPRNGDMHCTRSRHRTQLFYRTKCNIWCNKGYKLHGTSVRNCNGTGHWDEESPICIPQSCPRLPRPDHGTILPTNCVLGKIFAGERCHLHCDSGFKAVGKRVAVCGSDQQWEANAELRCQAVEQTDAIKPYIRCPADTQITLPRNQKLVYVQLEQPTSNVDWWKYIDSHPAWGKNLEAQLPIGVHVITFRARSPNSQLNDICRTVITVKSHTPPEVLYCPESFAVELEPHELGKSVYWKEPEFKSHTTIKQVYKSKAPGQRMGPGTHYVSYVATDSDGVSSKCNFRIDIKGKSQQLRQEPHRLDNHESYLLCPGKSAIKVETNYPMHLPRGCHIKNIRMRNRDLNNPTDHRTGTYVSNKALTHYGTWDKNPNARHYNSRHWKK